MFVIMPGIVDSVDNDVTSLSINTNGHSAKI